MNRTPWTERPGHAQRRAGIALLALVLLVAAAIALPAGTAAEQASQPTSPAAGQLDVSGGATDNSGHTCARLADSAVRCWGFGGDGRLGYGNTSTIGDDETPGAVEPVDLGEGRTAEAITAGAFHSCGLLDDGSVRCWGFGGEGRLGYESEDAVGDDEAPGEVGPVDLGKRPTGEPLTAEAISAGASHTCAVLGDGSVRCWGFGDVGALGYGNDQNVGDDETPGEVAPVDLEGRTAKAISAGQNHTCALLDDNSVRCWGFGGNGALGYGTTQTIGENEKPGSRAVDLREGRSAKAISAGDGHTCALLDDDSVRCWGFGGNGRLGYGNSTSIGDNEPPGDVGPVDLGERPTGEPRTAKAVSAGDNHSCAVLDDDSVRCWGFGGDGRLGYASRADVGDNEAPGSVGPVDLGEGRTALAISAGGRHTCALLADDAAQPDEGDIRCWGDAATGRLGYCNAEDIGDNEPPGSVGPVNVTGASDCSPPGGGGETPPGPGGGGVPPVPDGGGGSAPTAAPGASPAPETGDSRVERRRELYRRALAAQADRKRALRSCYAKAGRHARREQRKIGGRDSARRAKRHIKRHRSSARRACRRRHGRTPGRVTRLSARSVSKKKVVLSFPAAGTDRRRPPAAREYVVKQSRRPIRGERRFRRAQTLCRGQCRFDVEFVGATIKLTVTGLRRRTSYYYSVAARDNVSGRQGRRSPTVKVRTRR